MSELTLCWMIGWIELIFDIRANVTIVATEHLIRLLIVIEFVMREHTDRLLNLVGRSRDIAGICDGRSRNLGDSTYNIFEEGHLQCCVFRIVAVYPANVHRQFLFCC